jgi:hypothetical protein
VLGAGMMKYADGSVYEGEWQDDVQNGRGETGPYGMEGLVGVETIFKLLVTVRVRFTE